jgi:ATP-dependent DNA helicase RecG
LASYSAFANTIGGLILPVLMPINNSNENLNDGKRKLSDVLKNVQKKNLEKLTERQIDILNFIVQDSTITLQEMSNRLNVSVKTIQRDFTAIRKLGIEIIRKDGKTYGEWVVRS